MGGLRFWDAKPRRSAETGQDSFPWPTTPIAASHNNGLTAELVGEEVLTIERVVCDRPCAALVLLRPCVSLDWSSQSRS